MTSRTVRISAISQGRDWVLAYAGLLAISAATLLVGLLAAGYGPGDVWVVAALGAVAAVAERGSIRLSANLEASISLLPTLFAAVLFGPVASSTVALCSMMGDFRRPYTKWAVYTSTRSITGALTGLLAAQTVEAGSNRIEAIALAAGLGALLSQVLDLCFASLTLVVRRNGQALDLVRAAAPSMFAAVPLYAPVVALLALAYDAMSDWTIFLFFAPALAAQRLFLLYEDQRRLTSQLVTANERLESANLSFATALVATLDARDRYTAGHSAAVAIYSRDIAARMGLSEDEQQLAHLAGLVHDIGKVGLTAGLLEKQGPLTLEERRQMATHSEIGERILANVRDYAQIAAVVRHHHERVDGQGYPDGLAREEIPLLSRIVAVADAYNAMTSDRPYRDAMPSRVARLRMAQAVETQFDTSVVAAFEAILAGASEEYRLGSSDEFALVVQEQQPDEISVAA